MNKLLSLAQEVVVCFERSLRRIVVVDEGGLPPSHSETILAGVSLSLWLIQSTFS